VHKRSGLQARLPSSGAVSAFPAPFEGGGEVRRSISAWVLATGGIGGSMARTAAFNPALPNAWDRGAGGRQRPLRLVRQVVWSAMKTRLGPAFAAAVELDQVVSSSRALAPPATRACASERATGPSSRRACASLELGTAGAEPVRPQAQSPATYRGPFAQRASRSQTAEVFRLGPPPAARRWSGRGTMTADG